MRDDEAWQFARQHISTWNQHDLEAILELYAESAELCSPVAGALVGGSVVRGRVALRQYFSRGLDQYPDLRFELVDVFVGARGVTLVMRGAGGRLVAETLTLNAKQEIERVVAHYRAEPR